MFETAGKTRTLSLSGCSVNDGTMYSHQIRRSGVTWKTRPRAASANGVLPGAHVRGEEGLAWRVLIRAGEFTGGQVDFEDAAVDYRLAGGRTVRADSARPIAEKHRITRVDAILTTIGVVVVIGISGAAYAAFLLLRGRK
ncbi:hypothetical protein ACIRRA_01020 [Nocardia sp. NPDC101769]|uniref:hypothetical protein n=1 Tax=Nocardia sp. NPDC101769 TaxID=3364333 RepID=UPI0038110F80